MSRPAGIRGALCIVIPCLASLGVWCGYCTLSRPIPIAAKPGPKLENTKVLLASGFSAPPTDSLDSRFATQVQPFFKRYCYSCHGPTKRKGQLDLSRYATVKAFATDPKRLDRVLKRLQGEEMPPEDAPRQPEADERAAVVAWIRDLQNREAQRNAGDPGTVLARRLSNAEFDYTIRDLTGVDMRPTREFPVDPANEAGFDNSGESLAMSPALLEEVPGGGAADRRPRRPEAGRLRLRAVSGRDRHRPRQVLRPAHHRLLRAP